MTAIFYKIKFGTLFLTRSNKYSRTFQHLECQQQSKSGCGKCRSKLALYIFMSLRPFQYTLSRYSFKIKFFSPSLYLMKMALNYSQILMKCFQILHCQILQEDGICVYLQLTQRLFQTSRNSFVFIDFSRKCKEGKSALESGQTDGQSDRK